MEVGNQNAGLNPEQNPDNNDRFGIQLRRYVNVDKANRQIKRFRNEISSPNNNPLIQNIATARAFYVEDVIKLIEANPGCRKLRVYNAFRRDGTYVTFMAAVKRNKTRNVEPEISASSIEGNTSYDVANKGSAKASESSSSDTVVIKSCCACRPPCIIR